MTRLLTVDDLAVILHVHARTIHKRRAAGTLGIEEINISTSDVRQPRFRLDNVEAYIEGRSTAPTIDDLHDLVGYLADSGAIPKPSSCGDVRAAIDQWWSETRK